MPSFVIFFVDFRESRRLNLPDNLAAPYGTLCRLVSSYGGPMFRLMWSDEENNLLPLISERTLVEALRSRRGPRGPLHVYVKGSRPPPDFTGNRAVRSRSNSGLRTVANRGVPLHVLHQDDRRVDGGKTCRSNDGKEWSINADVGIRIRPLPLHRIVCNQWTSVSSVRIPEGKQLKEPVMPQDPSLAELVDNVRHSLEAALKSVQFYGVSETRNPAGHGNMMADMMEQSTMEPVSSSTQAKKQDNRFEMGTADQEAEELKGNENESAGADTPRPCSSTSEEFMVLTPSTDSYPLVFDEHDFDAVFSETESEFEVVDAPDDWDSDVDIEWQSVIRTEVKY